MRKWIVLSLAVLFFAGAFFPLNDVSYAAESKAAKLYKSASARLAKVKKDRRKAKQRVQWERCISDFDLVIKKYPDTTYAGYSAFSKADCFSGIYNVTRVQADLDEAVKAYEAFVDKYPDNEYADEAIQRLAGIYMDRGDKTSAAKKYRLLVDNYPQSIYAKHAAEKLKAMGQGSGAAEQKQGVKSPQPPFDKGGQGGIPVAEKAVITEPATPVPAPKPAEAPAAIPKPAVKDKDGPVTISEIRHWSNPGYTRIVFDMDGKVKFKATRLKKPERIFFDLTRARLDGPLASGTTNMEDGLLLGIRASQYSPDTVRVVLDIDKSVKNYKAILLSDPERLMVDVYGKSEPKRKGKGRFITVKRGEYVEPLPPLPATAPVTAQAPPVNANISSASPKTITVTAGQPQRPAATAKAIPEPKVSEAEGEPNEDTEFETPIEPAELPLPKKVTPPPAPKQATPAPATAAVPKPAEQTKPVAQAPKPVPAQGVTFCDGRIVIDPGHGGHDTGAIGKDGLLEKDVVLDIGLRLRDIIVKVFGCKTIMTRDKDVFIPLESRTGIAAQQDADLFISIHANASKNRKAKGIETYILNLTKDRGIMALAAQENMMTMQKMGDLEVILKDLILDNKREDSLRLAHNVQDKLIDDLNEANDSLKDKGVKQGPFLVLYGASMPSILTEVGFISNPEEEKLLGSPDYRQKVAQAIFDGIKDYIAASDASEVAAYSPGK